MIIQLAEKYNRNSKKSEKSAYISLLLAHFCFSTSYY